MVFINKIDMFYGMFIGVCVVYDGICIYVLLWIINYKIVWFYKWM